MQRLRLASLVFASLALAFSETRAAYVDLVNAFTQIRQDTVFPVPSRTLDDIESAFGPRTQASTMLYDFHRGIDIDGGSIGDPVGVEDVVAVHDGTFYDYRTTTSGGNIVILRHTLPAPVAYEGQQVSHFFTWYLHLYDDGVANNGIGSADLVAGLSVGDAVPRGTLIGKLGDSGMPSSGTYAPHLHFELRIGTTSSLEFQLANPQTTQWGFDPHMNPMLLFAPASYGPAGYEQQLALAIPVQMGEDIRLNYQVTSDEMPLWNRFEFSIQEAGGGAVVASHVLDFNQRTGYDATSTANLDSRDLTKPYVDPLSGAFSADAFGSELVLPAAWTQGYQTADYEFTVNAYDLWGNLETITGSMAAVPEPVATTTVAGVALLGLALWRRCRSERAR